MGKSITHMWTIPVIFILLVCFDVWGITICDDFEIDHNYIIQGTAGTIWDGIIGKENLITMATDYNEGKLFIESGNNIWSGNSTGILIYKEVIGNWIATVTITDASGLYGGPPAADNSCGLMARVSAIDSAGPGEDWLALIYANGYLKIISVGDGIERILSFLIWPPSGEVGFMPIIGIEQVGGKFYFRYSADNFVWYSMPESPVQRSDMSGLPLQVGLMHASSSVGYGEFDNFCLENEKITKANSPIPADGGWMNLMRPICSWLPGDYSNDYIAYFSSDFNNVNESDPNALVPPECRISPIPGGRQGFDTSCCESLVTGRKYFWRVDEVNDFIIWKGDVWSFTNSNIIENYDDFEKDWTWPPITLEFYETIWDCVVGQEYLTYMGTDYNDGKLYIESLNGCWFGDNNGVLLCTEIKGDFTAFVQITNYPGLYGDSDIPWNSCGLMARVPNPADAGEGEDWIGLIVTGGYLKVINQDQIYSILSSITWLPENIPFQSYIQIQKYGDEFFFSYGPDGVTWISMPDSPVQRTDMNYLPLQLGLMHSTCSGNVGYAEFDNFRLLHYYPKGDLNGDYKVNYADIRILSDEWLTEGIYADIIDNDNVDFRDFAVLANSWLDYCR